MNTIGRVSPNYPTQELTMTATSLFIHAGFVTGLALALATSLTLT